MWQWRLRYNVVRFGALAQACIRRYVHWCACKISYRKTPTISEVVRILRNHHLQRNCLDSKGEFDALVLANIWIPQSPLNVLTPRALVSIYDRSFLQGAYSTQFADIAALDPAKRRLRRPNAFFGTLDATLRMSFRRCVPHSVSKCLIEMLVFYRCG